MLKTIPLAAQSVEAPSWIASGSILQLLMFAASILIVFTGIAVLANARKGNMKGAGASGAVVLIGTVIIVGGVGGIAFVIANGALGTLFGS